MRFYPLLLLAPVLLASCNPDPSPGPRVDLVGSTRFLSASRISSIPGDTFTTRVFADKREDGDANLSRLRITVDYSPTRNPYIYPANGFTYDSIPSDAGPLVFLDSMLTGAQQQSVAFQFNANTRTTSGRETWSFRAEDVNGRSNDGRFTGRSFRLTLRNADSTLAYHRYSLLLPAPTVPNSRSYLSLLSGLALPSYTLRQTPANQNLIDLVYLTLPNGSRALAAPIDQLFIGRSAFWTNRRATQLRATALDSATFFAADTQAELEAAFNNGVAFNPSTRTGPLTVRGAGRVIAFRTTDARAKTGLIFIQALPTTPTNGIRMQVRITK